MTSGSSFASRISLSTARARGYCSSFSHALIPAVYLKTSGSSFAPGISLSSARARCHCSPFSHAVIPALQLDDASLQLGLPHLAHQRQRPLPLLALLARAGPSAVGKMTPGSSFASRVSLSSASARCHCSPFSHALIPALYADDVGLQLRLPHLAQQRERPLPLPALLARADPSAVG
ncbi:unnamed protein product [Prorocentrum cordatum]|uniref:Uncharacterized protein n=1 Tax=Prorocentrum cordatum TaxID=2364126 RepID=A0ABN9SRR7_9DINO|nr:unnamed protein product [Polarella glacialis]